MKIVSNLIYFIIAALLLSGCEEVSSYSTNCKDFNEEYLAKLSEKNDLDSARELTTLYVECNANQDQKYTELAVEWSEKVMSFKEANQEDLKLYRALHDLDTDTGKPISE